MNLIQMYEFYQHLCAMPKTRNPIELVERRMMRNHVQRQIMEELDRRIASKENSLT